MLKSLFILLSLSSSLSFAQAQGKEDIRKSVFENMGFCDQAVFTDDNYMATSFPTLSQKPGFVRIVSLTNPQNVTDITAKDRIVDIKIQNEIVYILSGTTFEAWNIQTKKQLFAYPSHPQVTPSTHWRAKASGFILKDGKAIITHGVMGVSVLDLKTGNFIKLLPMPTVSSAQDIDVVNDSTAVLAIDNDDEGQFRGMYLMDLNSLAFTKQIKIDNAFPSAVRVLDNHRLMMIYFNAVWKFDLREALSSKEPLPNRRAWKFPGLFLVDMIGKVAFDQKNLYACFKTMDEQTGARRVVPLAIDLKSIQLK